MKRGATARRFDLHDRDIQSVCGQKFHQIYDWNRSDRLAVGNMSKAPLGLFDLTFSPRAVRTYLERVI